jgi:signal peptidase II
VGEALTPFRSRWPVCLPRSRGLFPSQAPVSFLAWTRTSEPLPLKAKMLCGTIRVFHQLLGKEMIVTTRRARVYDAIALLVVIVIVVLDEWTKSLVVAHLGPPDGGPIMPIIGQYLVLYYIQNSGAAFGAFANNAVLIVFIAIAICVVAYLYIRIVNAGPLIYKVVFAMIIGGALGNLLDRARNGGVVTDFIFFRIPEIHFYFAIFNIADACISVGVVLLFLLVLFGGLRHDKKDDAVPASTTSNTTSGTLRSTEQDAKS